MADLRTPIHYEPFVIDTSRRVHFFSIVPDSCDDEGVYVDTEYSFKLYQEGEEIYDISNLIISDTEENTIKFYKDESTVIAKGCYDYVLENVNMDNINAYFIAKGKFDVV